MSISDSWFEASKDGLRKLIEHLPKEMVVYELVQNVWDEDASFCRLTLERIPGSSYVKITCEDDVPNGFKHLDHAFTIWAESEKKADPEKRGRFNEGEKKVLALCRCAEISTTTGTVIFREDGKRTMSRRKTEKGSVFTGEIKLTIQQVKEIETAFLRLIPPGSCETSLDGDVLADRDPLCEFTTTLPTLNVDEEGQLRTSRRKTTVKVYEPEDGEEATLYERGIPVVVTGDTYHVSIEQKVPLNRDRDNVTPAYLRLVRAGVLNNTAHLLDEDEAAGKWVDDAFADDSCEKETIDKALDKRHGKKRSMHDRTDPEANATLFGAGYTVIPERSYSPEVRKKILDLGSARKSGALRPTPKPYSTDPDAPETEFIHPDNWSEGMKEVAEISQYLCKTLGITRKLEVSFVKPTQRHWAACWGDGSYEGDQCSLDFNVTRLGRKWFDNWSSHVEALLDLLIHEFAHHNASNHLSEEFHQNCTKYGAALAILLLKNPDGVPHFDALK